MSTWKIAGIQMDCQLGDTAKNRVKIRERLAEAAQLGAQLAIFPECVLTGYCFTDRAALAACADTLPGPSTDPIREDCIRLKMWAAFGMIEKHQTQLYNTVALFGPSGELVRYRKTHLPCLGADRFTNPGNEPLVVHDLGGLKVGIAICFDGSFPEVIRVLTLQGADLVILPTNWATTAIKNATLVSRVRAFENHIYYAAVNRVGQEGGYQFCGHSSICDYNGDYLAYAEHDQEGILIADIDPAAARQKRVVYCAGVYEIDRVNWRRPELYSPLVQPLSEPFSGHQKG